MSDYLHSGSGSAVNSDPVIAQKRKWVENACYFAECLTCEWSSGESQYVAARGMDHARRNAHQVVTHRTIEYDFRPPTTQETS